MIDRLVNKALGRPRLLARAEDAAEGSRLARQRAAIAPARERAEAASARVAALDAQLRDYERVLAQASPESDMHELAAAEVGARVVREHLAGARVEAQRRWDDHRVAEAQWRALWHDYERLAERLERAGWDSAVDEAALLAELQALGG